MSKKMFCVGLIVLLTAVFTAPAFADDTTHHGQPLSWTKPAAPVANNIPGVPSNLTATDPVGDTFGVLDPQIDITEVSVEYTATDLLVEFEFTTPITPADSGQPNALFGGFDLDLDQDPMTGIPPLADFFCPLTSGLGSEGFVDFGSVVGSTIDVVTDMSMGTGTVNFTPRGVRVTVPLSVLNGDDGMLDIVAVLGTGPEPTDCVPDGSVVTSSVSTFPIPTASEWGLALLASLLALGGVVLMRRLA